MIQKTATADNASFVANKMNVAFAVAVADVMCVTVGTLTATADVSTVLADNNVSVFTFNCYQY